tara:strand:- start:96 stop:644 length:549 start_codon:yes stop_codon:yes gene_type:complete
LDSEVNKSSGNLDFPLLQAHSNTKWSEPGLPHKNWHCVGEFDALDELGDLTVCDMCEKQRIRFVHVMAHALHDKQLNCGCVCASYMSGDALATETRERKMRSKALRRQKFPKRKGWKISARGNTQIKADGVHIVIAKRQDGLHCIGSKRVWDKDYIWDRRGFTSVDEAKLEAFEKYEKLRPV